MTMINIFLSTENSKKKIQITEICIIKSENFQKKIFKTKHFHLVYIPFDIINNKEAKNYPILIKDKRKQLSQVRVQGNNVNFI